MNSSTHTHHKEETPTSIKVDNIRLDINQKRVLDNLTFDLQAKRLGIIGRNGSGKSTLSRVLSGLIEISSGELTVAGINPFKDRKSAILER